MFYWLFSKKPINYSVLLLCHSNTLPCSRNIRSCSEEMLGNILIYRTKVTSVSDRIFILISIILRQDRINQGEVSECPHSVSLGIPSFLVLNIMRNTKCSSLFHQWLVNWLMTEFIRGGWKRFFKTYDGMVLYNPLKLLLGWISHLFFVLGVQNKRKRLRTFS